MVHPAKPVAAGGVRTPVFTRYISIACMARRPYPAAAVLLNGIVSPLLFGPLGVMCITVSQVALRCHRKRSGRRSCTNPEPGDDQCGFTLRRSASHTHVLVEV